MVNARSLAARILANITIWGILGLGSFYVLIFKDYTMGFELAVLSLSLAFAQMATHAFAVQWSKSSPAGDRILADFPQFSHSSSWDA